jgi:hypothetical protein
MKQVLIQRAGSLRQAYAALDVNGSGRVDLLEFEKGLGSLKVYACPVGDFLSLERLFQHLAKGKQELLLQEFLGYLPIDKTSGSKGADTRTQWRNYHNKTSVLPSKLTRKPAWDPRRLQKPLTNDDIEGCFMDSESARRKRKNDLRQQFRDLRSNMQMNEKRGLVRCLVPQEEAGDRIAVEHRKAVQSGHRIGNAMRDCTKSRQRLVDMQRVMCHLSLGYPLQSCAVLETSSLE